MSTAFLPRVGGVLSADIAVPEHEREVRFYSQVLTTGEKPHWREDLMNSAGMAIIGLGPRSEEYDHFPIQWMPHFQVADVGASVGQALELGGKELAHGKDAEGKSQWAVLTDPNGTAFGIIPVVSAEQMQVPESEAALDGAGCIAWLDLTVTQAPAIREFYQQVVGYTAEDVAMHDSTGSYADYNMLASDGVAAAGVCHDRGANEGLPSVWLMYLPVGDLEESLRRVVREGGKVLKETKGADGKVTCGVVEDPVGACFALAQG